MHASNCYTKKAIATQPPQRALRALHVDDATQGSTPFLPMMQESAPVRSYTRPRASSAYRRTCLKPAFLPLRDHSTHSVGGRKNKVRRHEHNSAGMGATQVPNSPTYARYLNDVPKTARQQTIHQFQGLPPPHRDEEKHDLIPTPTISVGQTKRVADTEG